VTDHFNLAWTFEPGGGLESAGSRVRFGRSFLAVVFVKVSERRKHLIFARRHASRRHRTDSFNPLIMRLAISGDQAQRMTRPAFVHHDVLACAVGHFVRRGEIGCT